VPKSAKFLLHDSKDKLPSPQGFCIVGLISYLSMLTHKSIAYDVN
jgi:hypothetical protein